MIEAVVYKAKRSIFRDKNTFIEGNLYFGRWSKTGECYVIRSEEGNWIPFWWIKYTYKIKYTYNRWTVSDSFERKFTIYMKNRKRLNKFDSVEHYFDGENCKKWWYATVFKDNEFVGGW